jgi:hypothetical protein
MDLETMLSDGRDSLSIFGIIGSFFTAIVNWFREGDLPPKSHRKSMAIMVALLVFGAAFVTIWISALLGRGIWAEVKSTGSLLAMAFITLCPGLYALWIAFCSWRKGKGYSWTMIPFFD